MKRKLVIILSISIIMLILVSCNGVKEGVESELSNIESEIESPGNSETPAPTEGGDILHSELIKEKFEKLEKGSYQDLKIDAFIKDRKASLPGDIIGVTVVIKNEGDKKIVFPMGSGANIIPDALVILVDGMQSVGAKEQLGPVTMDMRYDTLDPGQTKEFTIYVLAAKENAKFQEHILEYFNDTGKYLGETDTAEFFEKYTNMEKVEPGSYNATVYFEYKAAEADEEPIITSEDTSYNTAEFKIAIS